MGLSGGSKTQTNKPIYSSQIEGAANSVTNASNAQLPKITGITDQLGSLVPGLIDQYKNGDPNLNAAKDYNLDVLNGKYLNGSPQLDAIVNQTNNDTRNGAEASLGTRGLTGGSAYTDIIARALAANETGLRYTDYNNQLGRMDTAASQAPQLGAASYLPLSVIQSIAATQGLPVQTAAGAGSAVGGLLGQYQNTKQTSQPSLMDSIGQALNIGSTIAGFFPKGGG